MSATFAVHDDGTFPDLVLLFPGWQGAGEARPLLEGACEIGRRMRARLPPGIPMREVPVEDGARSSDGVRIHAYATVRAQLATARGLLLEEAPDRILVAGGDCSIEIAPVGYLAERYDDLQVLWFDAHGDLNTPESSPSGNLHGMSLRHLLGEGDPGILDLAPFPLDPADVHLIGARALDPDEERFISASGVSRISAEAVNEGRVAELLERAAGRPLYLHIDVDGLDPEEVPDAWYPTPNGIRVAALVELIARLREAGRLVGASITEYTDRGGESLPAIDRILEAIL